MGNNNDKKADMYNNIKLTCLLINIYFFSKQNSPINTLKINKWLEMADSPEDMGRMTVGTMHNSVSCTEEKHGRSRWTFTSQSAATVRSKHRHINSTGASQPRCVVHTEVGRKKKGWSRESFSVREIFHYPAVAEEALRSGKNKSTDATVYKTLDASGPECNNWTYINILT